MRKLLHSKKGFTLVELMVVVIIVGILAAVAVPLYRANTRRAMSSEGVAVLGSVRTAERVYFAEMGVYTADLSLLDGVDVTGNRYFTTAPAIVSDGATYTATITGDANGAEGIIVTIDQDGLIDVTL